MEDNMKAKYTDLEKLQGLFKKTGNQLIVLYGRKGCQKEQLIREFCAGKKYFYYRCRQASAQSQLEMMGKEIETAFKITLSILYHLHLWYLQFDTMVCF